MHLSTADLKSPMYKEEELDEIIRTFLMKQLHLPAGLDPFCFLKALSGKESAFGKMDRPRYEPAFAPGGIYFQKNKALRELHELYGPAVSCSYGALQIMYPTAIYYGFPKTDNPNELWDLTVSGPYVCVMLNDKIAKGAKTLEQLADGYNSGSFRDLITPKVSTYVKTFVQIYEMLLQRFKNS